MASFVLSLNGEEFFNQLSSPDLYPDPDHVRGGLSHRYNTTRVKKIKSIAAIVFELCARTDIQTDRARNEGNDRQYISNRNIGRPNVERRYRKTHEGDRNRERESGSTRTCRMTT